MDHDLFGKVKELSERCYKAAFKTITGRVYDWNNEKCRELSKTHYEIIAREYERNLCKLTTSQLELILECHEKKIMGRAPVTLSAIHGELLERELMKDDKEGSTPGKPGAKKADETSD